MDPTINIVVLQANEAQFGLVVDEVWDTEEIVVKPLSHQLREILVFAGATILGDGHVSLILDSSGLAERAGIFDGDRDVADADSLLDDPDANGESQSLLLLELGNKRAAIPLSAVSRLEEIASDRVEVAAERLVTQYRDQIMPLVAIGSTGPSVADVDDLPDEPLQVVVHARGDQNVGLVVERIHDIVHERIAIESTTRRPGVQGCAVVQGRVTDLLDVASIIDEALPARVEGSAHD